MCIFFIRLSDCPNDDSKSVGPARQRSSDRSNARARASSERARAPHNASDVDDADRVDVGANDANARARAEDDADAGAADEDGADDADDDADAGDRERGADLSLIHI